MRVGLMGVMIVDNSFESHSASIDNNENRIFPQQADYLLFCAFEPTIMKPYKHRSGFISPSG